MEPGNQDIAERENDTFRSDLQSVIAPLRIVIDQAKVDENESKLELDDYYPDIHSHKSGTGKFAFWAGIAPKGFHIDLPLKPTAVIKNIRIPDHLRRRRLGSQIVNIWETVLSQQGIGVFAATNIKDGAAIEFWKRLGYQIPKSETYKEIPYCMYKLIPPRLNNAPSNGGR